MKKLVLGIGLMLAVSAVGVGQTPIKIVTYPTLPSRAALERMNLTLAWRVRLPIFSNRDGLQSVQVLPGVGGVGSPQIVAQTHEGRLALYDGETGDQLWITGVVGLPFRAAEPVGFNDDSIFVIRRNVLHIVSRKSGLERLVKENKVTKVRNYGYTLSGAPSAPPVADATTMYVVTGSRLSAYALPPLGDEGAFENGKPAAEKKAAFEKLPTYGATSAGLQTEEHDPTREPTLVWTRKVDDNFVRTPLMLFGRSVTLTTTSGLVQSFDILAGVRRFELQTDGAINEAPAQYLGTAYVVSNDLNVYAVGVETGGVAWRYVAGTTFERGPQVNDDGLFIFPFRAGMRLLGRNAGHPRWENRQVDRFLASNHKFVYAMDKHRKFHVLDANKGTSLAGYDLTDWTHAIANEWTDRVYLAANDGQIICLRSRDLPAPLSMKPFREPEVKKPVEKKKAEPEAFAPVPSRDAYVTVGRQAVEVALWAERREDRARR